MKQEFLTVLRSVEVWGSNIYSHCSSCFSLSSTVTFLMETIWKFILLLRLRELLVDPPLRRAHPSPLNSWTWRPSSMPCPARHHPPIRSRPPSAPPIARRPPVLRPIATKPVLRQNYSPQATTPAIAVSCRPVLRVGNLPVPPYPLCLLLLNLMQWITNLLQLSTTKLSRIVQAFPQLAAAAATVLLEVPAALVNRRLAHSPWLPPCRDWMLAAAPAAARRH